MTDHPNDQNPFSPKLTTREAEDLTEAIADVAVAGLPLAEGLQAAASETRNGRVARQLRWIASHVQVGGSVEDALAAPHGRLPGYVAGVIKAALRTGRLGEVLVELVDHQQTVRDMWRTIRIALSYPAILLLLASAIGLWVELYLVGPMITMFEEFGLELPTVTKVLVWGYEYGIRWVLGGGAVFGVAVALLRLVGGRARWRRFLGTVPIIGVLWHWSGVAELSRVLAVLTDQDIPLPEALRLAADGTHDADMCELSLELATGVEQGRLLSDLVTATYRLPATLAPIIHWGEHSGELPEAFRRAAEMFEGRVQMRASLVKGILPPLIFIAVATVALLLILGLYAPMISMIQGLS